MLLECLREGCDILVEGLSFEKIATVLNALDLKTKGSGNTRWYRPLFARCWHDSDAMGKRPCALLPAFGLVKRALVIF